MFQNKNNYRTNNYYVIYGAHVRISYPKLQPEKSKYIVTIVTCHVTTCVTFLIVIFQRLRCRFLLF